MSKNVLITGGCGFIGRHVARELLEHGYSVRVLDSIIEQVHGGAVPMRQAEIEYVFADIRDSEAVRTAMEGITDVIHLAAEVGVGQSQYEIARYVGANDLGTAVLLEAMIDAPVETIAVASSMSVYGEGRYVGRNGSLQEKVRRTASDLESRIWNPRDQSGAPLEPVATDEDKPVDLASIYALTKYSQERQVLIFAEAYRRKAVALRLFNVFGPGQALGNPYTGVLANFAARLANGQRPMVFEDGEQRRDFVHVRDVARAFRLALERPEGAGAVVNIGSGSSYAIGDVARMLAQAMDLPDLQPEFLHKARSGDIRHCFADTSRAADLLGYSPRHLLEDSLEEIVAWVRQGDVVDRGPEMRRQLELRGLVA